MVTLDRRNQLLATYPQAIGWSIMALGFFIFVILCVALTFGVYAFFFESRIDLTVYFTVTRGSVAITRLDGENILTGTQQLEDVKSLFVDDSQQGYLTFVDNYSKNTVATIFVLPNTRLNLDENRRPRFDFSRRPYTIRLSQLVGQFHVMLPEKLGRETVLDLSSPYGTATLNRAGDYQIDAAKNALNVTVRRGLAQVRNVAQQAWQIPSQQLGTLERDTQLTAVTPLPYIVLNDPFGSKADLALYSGQPKNWGCESNSDQADKPRGQFVGVLTDLDDVGLSMKRQGESLPHGETGCRFTFRDPQDSSKLLNISDRKFTSLRVRARIKILDQDLSTCGFLGTECPVMLELQYQTEAKDSTGKVVPTTFVWRHGFFASRVENDSYPLICDTCPQVHERIAKDTWYLYDSGDLFRILGERKPKWIDHIRVYASGHAYDVVVADVEVLAGTTTVVP